ncbi:MAG: stage V sporulation protein AE [Sarcina sp.]
MNYILAFVIGGFICVVGQLIKDLTKITPGKILVVFVLVGLVLGAIGIYPKLIDIAGAGASVPLTGFGNSLAKGVMQAVKEEGAIGIFTGGIRGTSGGITAAIVFAYLMAIIFSPKTK